MGQGGREVDVGVRGEVGEGEERYGEGRREVGRGERWGKLAGGRGGKEGCPGSGAHRGPRRQGPRYPLWLSP